jgi:hypothetical protein
MCILIFKYLESKLWHCSGKYAICNYSAMSLSRTTYYTSLRSNTVYRVFQKE